MQISLKIALLIIMLIYLFCIAKSVKNKNMRIGYLIFWMIIGILLVIILKNLSNGFAVNFHIPLRMNLYEILKEKHILNFEKQLDINEFQKDEYEIE